ncbi:glycerol-3-phosphate 1-O-acyltransferase PlsY [uncultured Veillonella sp.]|uniref:glycerol-3-phosphate 1-O-acyltransferase PlsY n=1 Tax=uncultured Veillonella sp. TaxID=159268 RepID=UPI0025EBE825|nr:glycerol-3-phosphate 1-O-acyltransferase PlsY [uncultured Veillonella sp.]MDY3973785.1 glycerol-3-phosphate 1-O-acyltransferase PlsY [Veillonella caviae]
MISSSIVLFALLAYVLGSIPTGLIIGKLFFKTDVRQYGSKNIGATNTYRVLGLKAAIPVFLGDALKGMAGVWLFSPHENLMLLGGILAMVGHNWSIFLGFKGGRGVATGLGVLIFLVPLVSAICFGTWAIIVGLTKYVSLGSIVGAALVPILMFVFGEPLPYILFGLLAALFVIVRHRENIMRLIKGQELKVERTKEK